MSPSLSKGKERSAEIHKAGKGKDRAGSLNAEETLRKAAEEEAERKRIAEEARLAAQREEELKLKREASVRLNGPDKQKDLTNWVKSVPLSDSCFDRIDRAFSDGSLLAEVIHHFCPSLCDKRQYFRWNSKHNKISNWQALNLKVFPKMGFRLSEKQMSNLMSPFSCGKHQKNCEKGLFIFKLLERVRKELAERNPQVFDYRKSDFVKPVCEKKPIRRKLVNFLEHPPYSKIEWLLEQGFYDRDGKEKEQSTSASCYSKSESCIPTFFPCSFTGAECFTFVGDDPNSNGICIQPSLNCRWVQSTERCFLC